MKRKTIITDVGESLEIKTEDKYTYPIDDLIEFLNEAKNIGAEHVYVWGGSDWEDGGINEVNLQPIILTMESDEDFESRKLKKEESDDKHRKYNESLERKQLASLKDKYEK